eukprot:2366488-Amphidinium_carterae.1
MQNKKGCNPLQPRGLDALSTSELVCLRIFSPRAPSYTRVNASFQNDYLTDSSYCVGVCVIACFWFKVLLSEVSLLRGGYGKSWNTIDLCLSAEVRLESLQTTQEK